MLNKLRVGLAVATRALRPASLYSVNSSDSDSTDRDSVHSDPTHLLSPSEIEDIYSPVEFGPAAYEAPLSLTHTLPSAVYDTVEYCSRYDIYEEYGFDELYEPVEFRGDEV